MKRRTFIKNSVLSTTVLGSYVTSKAHGHSGEFYGHNAFSITKPDKKTVRIAVIQQDGNPGQVEINRKKALGFAEQALNQNADVILFHEELLVGYVKNLKELAEPLNGPTSKAFQRLLKGTESIVIYGLTEKDNDDYYISAPVVSADGIIENYRKTHLWWKDQDLRHEPTFYKPGNKLVTFNIKGFKSGIMICYDGDFPEMTRSYANLGCTMLFWINNRGSRGYDEVKDLANRNSIIIPTACCCGLNEQGNICSGGSNITGSKGELIDEIWDKEGMIISNVYPDQVSNIRNENPWFKGQRPDVYYY